MKLLLGFFILAFSNYSLAQVVPIPKQKILCNPLVIGSIPKKALSFQYEIQNSFENSNTANYSLPLTSSLSKINSVQGFRFNYYKNIITKPKTYVTVDIGYWYSKFNVSNSNPVSVFMKDLNETNFHSLTATTNIFKPLSSKNFILINASLELNGNAKSFENVGTRNLFVGGAIIYGWKKGLSSMTGVGILRAYRLGRVVHVPAFLLNKNFNSKWGVEMLLPARAYLRYTPNKKNILTTGFDLEGGQFTYASNNPALNNTFFQRGEIRPKIGWERELSKNCRFSVNAGVRINGRMNLADGYDSKSLVIENSPKTNLFINVGFHVMNLNFGGKRK